MYNRPGNRYSAALHGVYQEEIGDEIGNAAQSAYDPRSVIKPGLASEKHPDTGYKGRAGIYELLMIDDVVRELIVKRSDAVKIKKTAVKNNMKTLRDDGALKVIRGVTSVAEVLAETQEDEL